MSRVLVVEDESAIAELVAINLRHAGYEVTLAASAEQAQGGKDASEIDARASRRREVDVEVGAGLASEIL